MLLCAMQAEVYMCGRQCRQEAHESDKAQDIGGIEAERTA